MLNYEIYSKEGVLLEEGKENYQSVSSFMTYALHSEKKQFAEYFANYNTIILKGTDAPPEGYKIQKTPVIYADKWDNYSSKDQKRQPLVDDVINHLKQYGRVRISFDYEGRTRHQTASLILRDTVKEQCDFEVYAEIGYNYHCILSTQPLEA